MTIIWKKGDERYLDHTFSQEDVKQFIKLSGDDNPLHMDEDAARNSAAGGVVVHGMLAATFISTLIGKEIPGPGALWNGFSIKWRKPIRIDDTIRFHARVTTVHTSTNSLKLEITGTNRNSDEQVLIGNADVMLLEQKKEKMTSAGLNNKRILITGVGGVLGESVAQTLAYAGCHLVLMGRNMENIQRVAAGLPSNSSVEIAIVDLMSKESLDNVLDDLIGQAPFHGIVHIASPRPRMIGVAAPNNLEALEEQWRVNVAAFAQIVTRLFPTMEKGGVILGVLTQALLTMPPTKMSAYISAKAGLLSLIRSMSVELGPHGIRCSAVSPGMMNTPFSEFASVSTKQIEAAKTPLRRLCKPEEVANAIRFLLGPESDFINGINLPITGGLH